MGTMMDGRFGLVRLEGCHGWLGHVRGLGLINRSRCTADQARLRREEVGAYIALVLAGNQRKLLAG